MRFPSEQFDAAVAATCHGTASEELLDELTALLRDEPAALDAYIWQKEIHSRLATSDFFVHDLVRAEHPEPTADVAGARPAGRIWLATGGMAILAGALVFVAVLINRPTLRNDDFASRPAADAAASPVVARLAEIDGVGWVGPADAHAVGDAVRAGEMLELAAGRLRLDFLCGASVWLTAPAIFEAESRQSGRLTAGRVQVTASTPEAKGFTIHTRTASVVDLGTEFTAEATLDGRCRVGVTSGEVQVKLAPGAGTEGSVLHLLKAGDIMNVEPGAARIATRIEQGDDSPAFRFPTISPPSGNDFADRSRGKAAIACVKGTLYRDSGIASGPVELLLDGKGQSKSDAPGESVYFENNTSGCLLLDLGREVTVTKVNTYSWHHNADITTDHTRATQKYDLYGFPGDEPPGVGDTPAADGWIVIARVNTDSYFGRTHEFRPAQQATSITGGNGSLGRYRYLLFVVQPTRDEPLPDDTWRRLLDNTFFGEIDVYAE